MSCDNPIIQAITPEDFKNEFWRDFSFISNWSSTELYNKGNKVFYTDTRNFYESLQDNVTGGLPTDSNWKEISKIGLVSDLDIEKAFREACVIFNDSYFTSDDDIKLGYLYLVAHYLVKDLTRNDELNDPSFVGWGASRTVGSVSESYVIPEFYTKNPAFSYFATTPYGRKYLSLIYPSLIGRVFTVAGATTP